jgi:O-antigen/teichoic acid export membrane protein
MFDELKNTFQKTAIYSLGNLSSKVIGFVLLPLYTGYLSLSDYGILAILEATSQILIGIFGLNLTTSMMRWCASEQYEIKRKQIISSTLFTTIFISVVFSLLFVPYSKEISSIIFSTVKFEYYIKILLLSVSLGILSNIPLEVIRFREKAGFYIFLSITKLVLILALNIYFIVFKKMGVEGIILSQLIGYGYVIVASLPFLLKNLCLSFDVKVVTDMMRFGFPLIFSTSALLALALGDRYIIKYFIDDASVGIYSLGHKVASVINIFILQSFQVGYLPIAYKKLNSPNAPRYYSKVATYLILILVISSLTLSMFSKEVIQFFSLNSDYWISYTVVPLVSLAFTFKGLQYVFSLPFHFVKKTTYIAYIVTFTALLNFGLNILFVPKFGYMAAAVVMVFSYLLMSLLYYYFSRNLYNIPFELKKILTIITVGICIYLISLLLNETNLILRFPSKIILLFALPLSLYFLNFFETIELTRIKNIFKNKNIG